MTSNLKTVWDSIKVLKLFFKIFQIIKKCNKNFKINYEIKLDIYYY